MRSAAPTSLSDRASSLERLQREAEAEAARLGFEERSLAEQVRRAREQVRYYEGLLVEIRRSLGRTPALSRILRRLP
jgi:hypothetical protein